MHGQQNIKKNRITCLFEIKFMKPVIVQFRSSSFLRSKRRATDIIKEYINFRQTRRLMMFEIFLYFDN